MTEKILDKVFENFESPESTPGKRHLNNGTSKQRSSRLTNEEICSKYNKILVQDTPTPFMNRSKSHISIEKTDLATYRQINGIATKTGKSTRVIPNTPVVRSLSTQHSTKKVKKLFDNNALLFEEEDLPGVETKFSFIPTNSTNSKKSQEHVKKISSLFKPKLSFNNKENDAADLGCDLSFETLEKRQRRRNPLIARLSEIEAISNDSEKAKNTEAVTEPNEDDEQSAPSSPILVGANLKSAQSETYNSEFTKSLKKLTPNSNLKNRNYQTPWSKTPMSFSSKFMTINNSRSFTCVTEHEFSKTVQTTFKDTVLGESNNSTSADDDNEAKSDQQQEEKSTDQTTEFTKGQENDETETELNETDIDSILFDGLKISSTKNFESLITKHKPLSVNRSFRLVDKTNTTVPKVTKTSSKVKANLLNKSKKKKYFPSEIKIFNFSCFDLKMTQIDQMKQVVNELNSQYSESNKNKINCLINKEFNLNTTHLIIDFNGTFERDLKQLDTNRKFLLLLAAIKNCKLIRFEWLLHSFKKSYWIDEDRYLIQSYIGSDLDQYEENDFDIKLIKFIRGLNQTSKMSLFSSCGFIYLLKNEEDYLNSLSSDSVANKSQSSSFSDSFSKFSDSFSIFKSKNKLYDHVFELITKCEGRITSRVACADLIVYIDILGDSGSDKRSDKESEYLEGCLGDIEKTIKKSRKRKQLEVVSSDWIMDCVIQNTKLEKKAYEIGWINCKID